MQCYKIINISQSPKFCKVILRLLHSMASWKPSIFFWTVWMGLITLKCCNLQKNMFLIHVMFPTFVFHTIFCLRFCFHAMCLVHRLWQLLFLYFIAFLHRPSCQVWNTQNIFQALIDIWMYKRSLNIVHKPTNMNMSKRAWLHEQDQNKI